MSLVLVGCKTEISQTYPKKEAKDKDKKLKKKNLKPSKPSLKIKVQIKESEEDKKIREEVKKELEEMRNQVLQVPDIQDEEDQPQENQPQEENIPQQDEEGTSKRKTLTTDEVEKITKALRSGDLDYIKKIFDTVDNKVLRDVYTPEGSNMLLIAIGGKAGNRVEIVKYLLKQGFDVHVGTNEKAVKQFSPLYLASYAYSAPHAKEMVNLLLENNADPLVSGRGISVIYLIFPLIKEEKKEVLEVLLKNLKEKGGPELVCKMLNQHPGNYKSILYEIADRRKYWFWEMFKDIKGLNFDMQFGSKLVTAAHIHIGRSFSYGKEKVSARVRKSYKSSHSFTKALFKNTDPTIKNSDGNNIIRLMVLATKTSNPSSGDKYLLKQFKSVAKDISKDKLKAALNDKDKDGNTPLHIAYKMVEEGLLTDLSVPRYLKDNFPTDQTIRNEDGKIPKKLLTDKRREKLTENWEDKYKDKVKRGKRKFKRKAKSIGRKISGKFSSSND